MDHFHYYFYEDRETLILLKQILKLTKTIMSKQEELTAKIAELQTSVDEEQQAISNALGALSEEIQLLKDQIAAGGGVSDAQLQEAINSIDQIIEDVKSTIPNLPDPEEPEA